MYHKKIAGSSTNNGALIALIILKRISLRFPILSSLDREAPLDREESPTEQLEASQWCQPHPVKKVIKTLKFEDSTLTDHEHIIYILELNVLCEDNRLTFKLIALNEV